MDNIKLFAKNKTELETNICSENTQLGHRDGIWQRKMRHVCNEKWQTTPDRWNGTTESRKNQNARIKENRQILRNMVS